MICKTCKEEKGELFYKNSLSCKTCRSFQTNEWRKKNKEKVRLAENKRRKLNREKINEYNRKRYVKNHEKRLNSSRKWRENNREKSRENTRKWQIKNVEKIKDYIQKNKDKQKEYHKKYKEKNIEKFKENARKSVALSRKKFPEKIMARKFLFSVVRSGLMTRPSNCSRCLIECKPDGHHPDYSKPLDVIWLCKKCHVKEHKQCKTALHKE